MLARDRDIAKEIRANALIRMSKEQVGGKFRSNWESPYKMIQLTGKLDYHLEDLESKQVPRP